MTVTDSLDLSPAAQQRLLALLLAALMVLSVVAGTIVLTGTAAAGAVASTSDPGALEDTAAACTTVGFDEFRTDDAIVAQLKNGTNETVRKQLSQVTVGTDNGFYRVSATNPNGYCVRFVVQVHGDVFPPADLPGSVESTNGEYVGNWTSVYDWETETLYTRITFTLQANSSATFAPSSARVFTLSWASREPKKSKGFFEQQYDRLTENDTVDQQVYRIDASEFDREPPFNVVVPLQHPETGERLDDQEAVYSTDGGSTWRPVGDRTTAPVYKSYINNGTDMRFTFNDADVEVKFVANPGSREKFGLGYDTWMTGAYDVADSIIPGDYFQVTRKDAKAEQETG